jgi:hypothetical protein
VLSRFGSVRWCSCFMVCSVSSELWMHLTTNLLQTKHLTNFNLYLLKNMSSRQEMYVFERICMFSPWPSSWMLWDSTDVVPINLILWSKWLYHHHVIQLSYPLPPILATCFVAVELKIQHNTYQTPASYSYVWNLLLLWWHQNICTTARINLPDLNVSLEYIIGL